MSNKKIQIKINENLKDYRVGDVIEIDTDKDGVPLGRYWRDRLKDAQIDNCIELIQETKRSKK